jgi:hypothetical protein
VIGEIEALLDHSVDIDRLAGAFARVQQHVLDNCIGALAVPLVGWVAVTNFCCGYSLTLSARYVHRRPLPTGAGGRETKSSSCSRAQLPSTHVVVDSGRATHQRGSFVSARLRSASAQKQKLMCASSQTFRSTSAIIRMRGSRTGGPHAKNTKYCVGPSRHLRQCDGITEQNNRREDVTENHVIVEGLYVALPSDMKTFPEELVPLP